MNEDNGRVYAHRSIARMNAILALEDGTWYRGIAAGAQGERRARSCSTRA